MKTLLCAPHGDRDSVPGNRGNSGGFNLIELLVVIAVMATMAAMLFPAFSKAKHQVKAASCFGNHKQLAAAFHMYSQDNGDRIVQVADYETGEMIYPGGGFWGGPVKGPGWRNAEEALDAVQTGLQTSNAFYFYCGNVRLYHCPGDLRILRNPNPNHPNGWAYDSYSRTQNLGGDPYDNYFGAGATYRRVSAIMLPGSAFSLIEDADRSGFNRGTWALNWFGRSDFIWRRPPAIWHDNISSISYADGHAELHKWLQREILSGGHHAGDGFEDHEWVGDVYGPDHEFVYRGYQFPGHP